MLTKQNHKNTNIYKDIVVHGLKFAGQEWRDKVSLLREKLLNSGHYSMVVMELDEIAWLFKLGGRERATMKVCFTLQHLNQWLW